MLVQLALQKGMFISECSQHYGIKRHVRNVPKKQALSSDATMPPRSSSRLPAAVLNDRADGRPKAPATRSRGVLLVVLFRLHESSLQSGEVTPRCTVKKCVGSLYEKRICSIRMPTPFVSTEPFSVLLFGFFFKITGAPFAGNATLETTHAFNRGYCVLSFPF
jgi:hypothetical protein